MTQHTHFVGIGGYGMSGLARIYYEMGHKVTGSDAKPSERTKSLEERGITVHIGHRPENLGRAEIVVFSTDVPADNPELAAARAAGLQVVHRSEMLARLINPRYGIAVAGTHGKTSTTSMVATILHHAGLDPTVSVGGELEICGGTGRLGRSRYVVAEADESDGSFQRYYPTISVATNIEPEHLEHYGGDFGRVREAYRVFLSQTKPGGLAVLCGDDPELRAMAPHLTGLRTVLYGFGPGNDLRADNLGRQDGRSAYDVFFRGRALGRAVLPVPGKHMILNSLAAMAVSVELGLDFGAAVRALASFGNAKRRFQIVGRPGGVRIVDDYAHHPTEIQATIRAAREGASGRLLAVFQPQRYTRTSNLMNEFSRAFSGTDFLILTEIYSPPGEKPIPGVSSRILAEMIERAAGHPVELISDQNGIVGRLSEVARPGDTVLTMGAGDIWQVAHKLAEQLTHSRVV